MYKLKSELTEKQIESDVATYLGWCTPNDSFPFRLLDIDEQITGADKKFDRVFPLYLQFKVSEGLKPLNDNRLTAKAKTYPLNLIRIFREQNSLNDNPTLYFKLRKLAKTATELQHNTLLKFANTGFCQAMYVAPLSLKKEEYENKLFNRPHRYLDYPFFDRDYELYQSSWISNFLQVPFLRDHISIIPHERVETPEHYYSYSNTGTEVAFHSPFLLNNEDFRLSTQLTKIVKNLLFERKNEKYTLGNAIKNIETILEIDNSEINNDQDSLEILKEIGQEIYSRFEIRQILFLFKSENNFR